jgi:hypothetical protein
MFPKAASFKKGLWVLMGDAADYCINCGKYGWVSFGLGDAGQDSMLCGICIRTTKEAKEQGRARW